jgi:hypothetical protein
MPSNFSNFPIRLVQVDEEDSIEESRPKKKHTSTVHGRIHRRDFYPFLIALLWISSLTFAFLRPAFSLTQQVEMKQNQVRFENRAIPNW